jgi:hypothetical protein
MLCSICYVRCERREQIQSASFPKRDAPVSKLKS